MRVLIFTDSRGQHRPKGSSHEMFPSKLAKDPRFEVELYLCPFKWTTILDLFACFTSEQLSAFDLVIVYAGIVDWSPRPASSAIHSVYNSPTEENTGNIKLNSDKYQEKVVNNKKNSFDAIFGGRTMASHLGNPLPVVYEGEQTLNMYSLEMAKENLIPRLRQLTNLLFINSNRFVPGWDGDYWKARPANIGITEQYSSIFFEELGPERCINLLDWSEGDVKKYTCDNLHLSAEGNEYIFQEIKSRIRSKLMIPRAFRSADETVPSLRQPTLEASALMRFLGADERQMCARTSLVIGVRFKEGDTVRINNLVFLLGWLERFYGRLFDILIVEQDDTPKISTFLPDLPTWIRTAFIFNPNAYNRGWGYNVAVRHHCAGFDVVALMDTDVLTGRGFVESILACHREFVAVSPYRNVYYTNQQEADQLRTDGTYNSFSRSEGIRNPVTICGGILIVRRAVFLEVQGFEQYVGYGCEDRALDVTLINKYGLDELLIVDEAYVHLHHPADSDERRNFALIYGHLVHNYGCAYDPSIKPHQYIHASCKHCSPQVTSMLSNLRSGSFGDPDLYAGPPEDLSINGVRRNRLLGPVPEAVLPSLHKALAANDFEKAAALCDLAFARYQDAPGLLKVVKSKYLELARRVHDDTRSRWPRRSSDTLVVLGNGPSLKYVMGNPRYREVLKRYDTFGLNAAYRAYEELDFWPTFHGCLDMIVVESHLQNYRALLPKVRQVFLLGQDHLGNDIIGFEHANLTKIIFDPATRDSNEKVISRDFGRFRNWQNSGVNCVQIGLMLGYERVVLLGMDANYKELVEEAEVIRDEKYKWDHLQIVNNVDKNDNYWFAGYQQPGDKYNIPNANKYHLPAWNALGTSAHSGRIINCTTSTKITTIRRQSFEETLAVVPQYVNLDQLPELVPLGVEPARLVGQVVRIEDWLFYISLEQDVLIRRFIPEDALQAMRAKRPDLHIVRGDRSLLDLPCHGVIQSDEVPVALLRPGLTFMVRARNERRNVYFVLGSLKHILANPSLNCDLVFVDNRSTDGTYEEVLRVAREVGIKNLYVTRYDVDVCRAGDAHTKLRSDEMHRSLDTFYNWCLDRVPTRYVIKWDCDFLAIQANLIKLIKRFELPTSSRPLAIWCTGKTLFKNGGDYFVNERTMYNEFRIFSKASGYRWQYAPRWEICSQEYMQNAEKHVYAACVFMELKDVSRNEFEFRSNGSAVLTDARDRRDAEIMQMIRAGDSCAQDACVHRLSFDPLAPACFADERLVKHEATLNELEAMQTYWLNVYSRPLGPIRFANKENVVIQALWVGPEISAIHRLCIESFLRVGHCYILYTYGPVRNVPEGVVIMDASRIVPDSLVYQFDGSYAGFSDLFRNKLLYLNGGWYVDLDIFCLRPLDFSESLVFSLDHYHPDTIKLKLGGNEIVQNKYYVATNPCKIEAGHPVVRSMYTVIFKKVVFQRLKSLWVTQRGDTEVLETTSSVSRDLITQKVESLGIQDDFQNFIGDLSALRDKVTFQDLLSTYGIKEKELGQSSWGEIGPTLVTREVVSQQLEQFATPPEMLQGIIKYFEVEKFLDPGFDWESRLKEANPYTIDFFFTMWRRKGLLDKFDTEAPCFLRHLRSLCSAPVSS